MTLVFQLCFPTTGMRSNTLSNINISLNNNLMQTTEQHSQNLGTQSDPRRYVHALAPNEMPLKYGPKWFGIEVSRAELPAAQF